MGVVVLDRLASCHLSGSVINDVGEYQASLLHFHLTIRFRPIANGAG